MHAGRYLLMKNGSDTKYLKLRICFHFTEVVVKHMRAAPPPLSYLTFLSFIYSYVKPNIFADRYFNFFFRSYQNNPLRGIGGL